MVQGRPKGSVTYSPEEIEQRKIQQREEYLNRSKQKTKCQIEFYKKTIPVLQEHIPFEMKCSSQSLKILLKTPEEIKYFMNLIKK